MTDSMERREPLYYAGIGGLMAALILCTVISPRFLAFGPGIIGLLGVAFYRPVFGTWPRLPKPVFIWCGAVIALAGISSFWALDPEFARARTLKMLGILMTAALLVSLSAQIRPEKLKACDKWIVGAAALSAGLIAFDLLFGFPVYKLLHGLSFDDYATGSRLNRGAAALVILFFPLLAIALKSGHKRLLWFFIAAYALMVYLTASLSAQLAFIIGLLFWFAFPYSKRWAWVAVGVILAGLLLATPWIAVWMFENLAELLTHHSLFRGSFAAQRLEIWDSVSRYALQNPLYGFGIEATRAVEAFDTQQIYRKAVTELHPHNFAVQIWMEFGVPGALFFAVLLGWLLRFMHKNLSYEQARTALPALMTFITVAAFGYGLWQSWLLGLIMSTVGFVILAARRAKKAE